MTVSVRNMAAGFFAATIAVVTVHEIIKAILFQAGLIPLVPWSLSPVPVTGLPHIISAMFWGGVWGVLFVLTYRMIPGNGPTMKGLIFGIIGPAVLGVFILVPLITGRFPLFFAGDLKLIISVLLILSGFGAAMGWLYSKFIAAF